MTSSTLVRGLALSLVVAMGATQAFGQAAQAVRGATQGAQAVSRVAGNTLQSLRSNEVAWTRVIQAARTNGAGALANRMGMVSAGSNAAAFANLARQLNEAVANNAELRAALQPALDTIAADGSVNASAFTAALGTVSGTAAVQQASARGADTLARAAVQISAQDNTKIAALEAALTSKGVSAATVAGMGVAIRAVTAATGVNPVGDGASKCVGEKFRSQVAIENVAGLFAATSGAADLRSANAKLAEYVAANKLGTGEPQDVLQAISGQMPQVAECDIVAREYANAR